MRVLQPLTRSDVAVNVTPVKAFTHGGKSSREMHAQSKCMMLSSEKHSAVAISHTQ